MIDPPPEHRWRRKDIPDEQVVRACVESHAEAFRRTSLAVLMEMTGAPAKVCAAAMERAVSRELIDYGVSLSTAWAEPAGRALLRNSR